MKKFLCVIDCQNDFIDGSLKNEKAQKVVPDIVEKINNFDGESIFVTMDTHDENYLSTSEGYYLPVEHCIKFTKGWEINKDIKEALDNSKCKVFYVEKPTFGSFELINLVQNIIPSPHEDNCEIEIIGFVSSICVISNAILLKTAFYENANIIVDTNCIAGLSEENNKAALEVLTSCQINLKK